ncbi:MAG: exo 1,3/1,4-beta-D-glucan glucohydrolase [Kangiellaceae bacterium]
MKRLNNLFILSVCLVLWGCNSSDNRSLKATKINEPLDSSVIKVWPKINSSVKLENDIEFKINELLKDMTLEQKVAQMIQPEIRDISVEDMRRYGFGSYLNGGGAFPNNNKHSTPNDWINLAEKMYQASIDDSLDGSKNPTMWGTDAVHGHNNVIGATLFPHNIGLGAMNNPKLMQEIATVTAKEVMVTGIDWVFAPTVATVRDDRWGRTYEGYSEHPEIVKSYAAAVVRGLQGQPGKDFLADNRVISTVKHFVGDGGTIDGDDQGNNPLTESELFRLHAQGYVGGLNAGAQTVMASFNSWQGDKIHGNRYLLTNVLKNRMGFDGLVVGDWNGHGQIVGCTNANCPQAINAGLDIFMVPTDAWKPLLETTIQQVKLGVISKSRIDDAVRRILRVKLRAGLFDKPSPANRMYSGKTEIIGSEVHRKIARQAVRESLVLLKNKQGVLPISPTKNILVAGDAAHNIGKQSGGWTITWQGTGNHNKEFPGGTSIYQGLANQVTAAGGNIELSESGEFKTRPDIAIVVFGEDPYAEGQGDISHLVFEAETKSSLAILKKLQQQGIPVVSLFVSGRPMWVNPELNASDAFVAVWLPGSEGEGIADVILKNAQDQIQHDFTGKLSFSWPKDPKQIVNWEDQPYEPLLAYGFGLTYRDKNILAENLDEELTHLSFQESSHNKQTMAQVISVPQTVLFRGGVKSPWAMAILSGESHRQIIANAQYLDGINYRTIDKDVQEDAIRLTFNTVDKSGFEIYSQGNLAQDLKINLKDKPSLRFQVKIDKPVTAEVLLSMKCKDNNQITDSNCGKKIPITKQMANLTVGQWHTLSVELACLNDHEGNFSSILSPFVLTSASPNQFSLANIVIQSQDESPNNLSCSETS